MSLPFVQVETDFITGKAPRIAALAGIPTPLALGQAVMLFAFIIPETSTDETPPTGLLADPDAAAILETVVGWTGEPGRLFGAWVRAGLVEKLEIGCRVRGMDRYVEAWDTAKRNRERAKLWRDQKKKKNATVPAPNANVCVPNAHGDVAERERTPGDGDGDGDGDGEVKQQKKSAAPVLPPAPPEHREAMAWLTWSDEARLKRHPSALQDPPEVGRFLAWWRQARQQVDVPRLRAAYEAFLADTWAKGLSPPCPWSAWAKSWRRWVPGQSAEPAVGHKAPLKVIPYDDDGGADAAAS